MFSRAASSSRFWSRNLSLVALSCAERAVEHTERQDDEGEVGRDRQRERAEAHERHFRQQRTQAGRHLRRSDDGAGGNDRGAAGEGRGGKRLAFLHHDRALRIADALHDGRCRCGADLADGRQLVGVVAPGRFGRVDVLRRPPGGELGLVGRTCRLPSGSRSRRSRWEWTAR